MTEQNVTIETGQMVANRYLIERVLGKGGMGCVYLARDKMLGDEVIALKVLHRDLLDDEKHTKRFLREAQLTRKITHPNVVRTFDVGDWNGNLFLTMEYAEGVSLKDKIGAGPLPWKEVARIVAEISRGLDDIHQQDVIHRDLKPGNVILTVQGAVKITDFGVARPQMSDLTGHNEIVGSAGYMAPEVWIGRKIGPQADLYSLGVMAFEMLVGELPFDAESPAELMCKHLEAKPFPPRDIVSDIPLWLNSLVLKLLAKEPLQRPQSALEVASTIDDNLRRSDTSQSMTGMMVDPELFAVLKNASSSEAATIPSDPPSVLGSNASLDSRRSAVTSGATVSSSRIPQPAVGIDGRLKTYSGPKSSRTSVLSKQVNAKSGVSGKDAQMNRGSLGLFLKVLSVLTVTASVGCLIYGLRILGDMYLSSWWGGIRPSTSLISIAVISTACAAIAGAVAAAPVVILGATGGGMAVSLRAWWRLSIYCIGIFWGMVTFYLLQLAIGGHRLVGEGAEQRVKDVIRVALENVLQVGLLSPYGSLYGVGGDDVMTMFPYFVCLGLFLFALTRVVRHEIYGEGSDRSLYVNGLLYSFVGSALIAEYLSRAYISQMLRWFSLRRHEVSIGGLLCGVEEYAIACALINWFLIGLIMFVLIPLISAHYHRSDSY